MKSGNNYKCIKSFKSFKKGDKVLVLKKINYRWIHSYFYKVLFKNDYYHIYKNEEMNFKKI